MTPRRLPLLFAAVAAGLAAAAMLARPEPAVGAGAPAAGDDATLVDRGQYLVTAGNCASCHTARGGAFMAGGVAFETPFGTLYATNITPDTETGLGAWTREDFRAAMRRGVRPDGEHLYPAFPYTAFAQLTDRDIDAMWAYLRRVPPVRSAPPPNDLSFPFNLRPLLAGWKLLYLRQGEFEPDPARSERWNRGAYLVEALGHCSACHTPRNALGAQVADAHLGGGEYVDRVPHAGSKPWYAPNLTASPRGLGLWSREDLERYLGTGRNAFLEAFGPMNEVVMNSTRYLDEADIEAMAVYLATVPPVAEAPGPAPESEVLGRGRTIYNLHCGTCHLPTGAGDPEMGPRLDAGSLVVQAANPASMINAILYGPDVAGADVAPRWREPMEAYRHVLDDAEIAAVATFVRNSWSNAAGAVTAAQVARQR